MKRKTQLNEFPMANIISAPKQLFSNEVKYILLNRLYKKIPELSYIPIKGNYELVALFNNDKYSDYIKNIILIARNRKNKKSICIGYVNFLYLMYGVPISFPAALIYSTTIIKDFIGYGIGEKVYEYLIEKYDCLGSDISLSPGARKLWFRLMHKNPSRYSVYILEGGALSAEKVYDFFYDLNGQLNLPNSRNETIFNSSTTRIMIVKKNSSTDLIIKRLRDKTNELEDIEIEREKDIEDREREKYLRQKSIRKMKKL